MKKEKKQHAASVPSAFARLFWWLPVGNVPEITADELARGLKRKRNVPQVLDVRTGREWELEHIPGAVNVPLAELKGRIHDLSLKPKKITAVICFSTARSKGAVRLLRLYGYEKSYQLAGGMREWKKRGLPLEGRG